jgi:hypothetical protein
MTSFFDDITKLKKEREKRAKEFKKCLFMSERPILISDSGDERDSVA